METPRDIEAEIGEAVDAVKFSQIAEFSKPHIHDPEKRKREFERWYYAPVREKLEFPCVDCGLEAQFTIHVKSEARCKKHFIIETGGKWEDEWDTKDITGQPTNCRNFKEG